MGGWWVTTYLFSRTSSITQAMLMGGWRAFMGCLYIEKATFHFTNHFIDMTLIVYRVAVNLSFHLLKPCNKFHVTWHCFGIKFVWPTYKPFKFYRAIMWFKGHLPNPSWGLLVVPWFTFWTTHDAFCHFVTTN